MLSLSEIFPQNLGNCGPFLRKKTAVMVFFLMTTFVYARSAKNSNLGAIDPKFEFLAERAAQMSVSGARATQETLKSSVPTTLKSSVPMEGSTGVAQVLVDKTENQDSSNADSFIQLKMNVDPSSLKMDSSLDPSLTLEMVNLKLGEEASSSSTGGGYLPPEPAWDPEFGYKVCRGDKWEDFKVKKWTPEGEMEDETPILVPVGDGEDGPPGTFQQLINENKLLEMQGKPPKPPITRIVAKVKGLPRPKAEGQGVENKEHYFFAQLINPWSPSDPDTGL